MNRYLANLKKTLQALMPTVWALGITMISHMINFLDLASWQNHVCHPFSRLQVYLQPRMNIAEQSL